MIIVFVYAIILHLYILWSWLLAPMLLIMPLYSVSKWINRLAHFVTFFAASCFGIRFANLKTKPPSNPIWKVEILFLTIYFSSFTWVVSNFLFPSCQKCCAANILPHVASDVPPFVSSEWSVISCQNVSFPDPPRQIPLHPLYSTCQISNSDSCWKICSVACQGRATEKGFAICFREQN